MHRMLSIGRSLLLLLVFVACSPALPDNEADPLLARVQQKTLHLSEMEGMFPEGISPTDSLDILNTYVSRWIREAVMLVEAEATVPANFDIDRLVRDYRASLVRTNYEKILVEQLLDSNILQSELEQFYEENKLLYELETPIVRCYFLKVPLPTPEAGQLRSLWNNDNTQSLAALQAYAESYAEVALLEDSLWYSVEEVADQLPPGTLTPANVGSKQDFTQRDEHHQYYFRLFELRNRTEIAPLSYVEEQARKVILHQRKLQLMEDVKEDMYERQMRENNIETFIN